MKLKELIEWLESQPAEVKVAHGFDCPHSYRGYYAELGFEMVENTTIGKMLEAAKSALGATYSGWKGGEYTMCEHTDCYLVPEEGMTGDEISEQTLLYMIGKDALTQVMAQRDGLLAALEAVDNALVDYQFCYGDKDHDIEAAWELVRAAIDSVHDLETAPSAATQQNADGGQQ